MTHTLCFFRSTIGKKMLVGLTGLGLGLFVLTHMAGNLLLLVGPEAYNKYSHKLITNPLIFVAEAGLVLMFLTHIGLTIQLTMRNRAARDVGYSAGTCTEKRTSFVAKTLILSGLLILTFTVLHLITFKWGTYTPVTYDGVEMRDLYSLVLEKFKQPGYVAWYVISLVVLGAHLSHGMSASLQSLGLSAANKPLLRNIGRAFAVVVSLGFIAQPIYLYFFGA